MKRPSHTLLISVHSLNLAKWPNSVMPVPSSRARTSTPGMTARIRFSRGGEDESLT